jgi:hypothetical protein
MAEYASLFRRVRLLKGNRLRPWIPGITDMFSNLELRAYLEKDGTREPFYLRISEPQSVADAEDFSCLVHAPLLFKSDKTIFGIDAQQAWDLAVQFVESLLDGRRITDSAGQPIKLEEL